MQREKERERERLIVIVNARIRSADLDIVALRGDEGSNQSSKSRRVDAIVVRNKDRWPVFHFFFFFREMITDRVQFELNLVSERGLNFKAAWLKVWEYYYRCTEL